MRGVISGIVSDGSYGQISAEDGQRYSYWTSEVRNGPVQAGQAVEFQMWEGQPVEIYGVPSVPPPNSPAPQRTAMPPQRAYQGGGGTPVFAGGPAAGFGAAAGEFPKSKDYWIKLFTSPSGRISRKQFWLHGVVPIVVCNVFLAWIPLVGQLLALVLLWGSVCIGFKRFHDLGYPGWYSLLYLVPIIVGVILFSLGFVMVSFLELFWRLGELLWAIGGLVALAQLIFVYVRVGQQGPNQYGPDPLAA